MEQNVGIRKKYANLNKEIGESLKSRKIDIEGILEKYVSGRDKEHIKILYRVNDEELSFILTRYITDEHRKKRKESMKKKAIGEKISSNLMGLSNEQRKKIECIPIEDAIALVEGNGEGEREE